MVNHFWPFHREIAQNNDHGNQIPNNNQSPNDHFITPRGMLQRSQSINNFTQGRYCENNNIGGRTQPMVPFNFSRNNTTSFITAARYGRMLPLGQPNGPQPHMSPQNNPLIPRYTNGFSNHSRPIFHNQKKFRYLPYGEGSNRMNNSFVFNDSNIPRPRIDINSFHGEKDVVIPMGTPPPPPPPPPPPFLPIQTKDVDMFCNANKDLSCERGVETHVFDIRNTEAWKRSMITLNECNDQTQKKELLLFKDDNNTISTNSNDANGNDMENLDLSLHL